MAPIAEQAELQRRLDELLDAADRLDGVLTDADQLSSDLDRAILGKAFRGELVPQDLNDEPADLTLARMRGANGTSATPAAKKSRRPREDHPDDP